jgi:hypothetical protein
MYKQHRHKSALKSFSVFFVMGQSWGNKIRQKKKKKIGKHNSTCGAVLGAQNEKVRRKKKF